MNNHSSPGKSGEPIAVLALRTVKPGCEERFEAELHELASRSPQTEGQLGVSVIRPVRESGSREYGILRRFCDSTCRDAFYKSPLFQQWELTVASLTDGKAKHQHLSGLETWFVLPGQRALIPPPPWKLALVTVAGVLPTSMFRGC